MSNTPNTFTSEFINKLEKFKKESLKYTESISFESRFNIFREKFEHEFYMNLRELDNSGVFEMFIPMTLHEDVKNEMVKLLTEQGFNETTPTNLNNVNDFYIQNINGDRSHFTVLKYKKIYLMTAK